MRSTHHGGRSEGAWIRNRALSTFVLSPRRITLIYLVLGFGALFVSDVLLVRTVSDPLLGQLQAIKGAVEVILTGGLIYGLTATRRAQVDTTRADFERQREELLVLHRVLRHNLRNDLNVIFGHSTSLSESLADEEDRTRCDVIHRKAEDILRYTEQAERIRRVGEGDGKRIVVDLATRVPQIVAAHPLVTDDVEVRYDLPERARVTVNRMFSEAVEEVLRNAIENSEGPRPTIDVSVDAGGGSLDRVELRIDDDGPGIPGFVPEILAETEYDQLAHLRGMGMWFVRWVVVESGGDLVIEESPAGGASVVMRLPPADAVSPVDALSATVDRLPF